MAVVSPVPTLTQRISLSRLDHIGVAGIMASRGEIVPEPVPVAQIIEDKIYVAVGKDVKDSRMTLIWALQNSGGKKICVICVLVPAQKIPFMGTELPVNAVKEEKVREHRETERHDMDELLDEYLLTCKQMGVRAEKLYIEKDSIEKGMLELITLHGIRKLVMGAASGRRYSRRMTELKSKKAVYIRDEAPISCHIWFICNGHLIYTREGVVTDRAKADAEAEAEAEASTSALQMSSPSNVGQLSFASSRSSSSQKSDPVKLTNPVQDMLIRVFSSNGNGRGVRLTASSSLNEAGESLTARSLLVGPGSYHEWDGIVRENPSPASVLSSCPSSPALDSASLSLSRTVTRERRLESTQLKDAAVSEHSSSPSVLDGSIDDNLCDQLERALVEAESAKRAALEEAINRGKAEKDFIDAVRRTKALESLYSEEVKQKRDIEQELAKQEEALEKMKCERDEVMNELHIALERKSSLEIQIAESDQVVQELEQKIISAVELLQSFKKERDDLQIERDSALKEAEELRTRQRESSSISTPRFYSEISFSEIEEATKNFDASLKIGEGGYGSIYKGLLRHTQVAIKIPHPHSLQGPSEFQQEVDVLSKVRHPNLVTLIGSCPEAWALIYEFLPNGSLEDRLSCRDNSPPLSWQTRVRIAAEMCSALIFLHSSKPHSIVHGDIKPANVLLDAHFVSKLGDFGICRFLHRDQSSSNNTTLLCRTEPKGTFAYMDPEFFSTGELSTKSDAYSFGIILLRLLTGRHALGIVKEVQYALDKGNLKALLDPLAGDWPFVQAEQLVHLALRCCDMNRKNRPNLESEVWRVLEPMRAFCRGSPSAPFGGGEQSQPPPYFICPILLEVMQDPHVAADGYTYEAEALRGWLESGHDSSPMTNYPLAHTNLVPNRALRSSIQEWVHNRST
ncbi:U-box domain-containing protein 33 [Punica granatum]|uniref:RING-type E3 ubiquitin transferase n=2 Tax=Punica granatum TaxID=22663 RepID=A0A218XUH2_PUNGR|nr:U-box domain-containing protein 33 [Punica granatum]XP_031391944.1 U-box domain-containing protein 33 [Punica granatum]OWM88201.1 hypothetical protein CDL15_Pgr003613 [Punica granatum]PKI32566.1 hypothetical protein CRG98_047029 [Punica granatum]